MSNPTRDWFLAQAARAVPFLIEHFDPATGRFHPEDWDERYNNIIYALAYLYLTEHPQNPHYRAEHVLHAALAGADQYVDSQTEAGEWPHGPSGGYCLSEWPAYYLTECLSLLGQGLPADQRGRWEKAITRYADQAVRRPFSFTSPSSEAWKCLALERAGQALNRDDWRQASLFQMTQLNKLQRPEGYWDEPVIGHGPSPSYHCLHVGALGLYASYRGEASLEEPLQRAIDFALTASYPDGTPLDCLDGRAAFSPEAALSAAPGLSRTPAGRQRLAALCRVLDELRGSDPAAMFASTWSAFIEPCFLVDAHRHFPEAGPETPGEPPASTSRQVGTSAMACSGPWFLGASGENSDVALLVPQRAASERQSRLSLWHDAWGVIVGGGSEARTSFMPLANVMVSTNYCEIDASFGEIRSFARLEPQDPTVVATAYHSPRGAAAELLPEGLDLRLVYGHGDVTIRFRVQSDELCALEFASRLLGVKSLSFQLPLLLTRATQLTVDGGVPQSLGLARREWLSRGIQDRLTLLRADRDVRVVIERPRDCKMRLHAPLHPGPGLREDEHFEPVTAVGLLSAQVSRSEGENTVTFVVRVERASR